MSPKDKLWFSNTNAHIINVVFLNLPRNTNAHNSNVVFYHQIAEPIYRINIQSYQHCCIHKECSFDVLKIQIQEHVYLGERLNPPPSLHKQLPIFTYTPVFNIWLYSQCCAYETCYSELTFVPILPRPLLKGRNLNITK